MVMMGGDLLPLLLNNLAGVWVEGVFAWDSLRTWVVPNPAPTLRMHKTTRKFKNVQVSRWAYNGWSWANNWSVTCIGHSK
jgi:hypothetical protein